MKFVLVDDEQLALDFLEFQLNKITEPESLHAFTHLDVSENESLLLEADVIFLDVEMPGRNGLELAEDIIAVNPNAKIVFVTGFNEYAVQAFELNALDYIVKPAQEERLSITLARFEKEKEEAIPDDSNTLYIQVSDELAFRFDDESVENLKWRTVKSREIFLYLLHFRYKTVRKSELIEMFWPDLDMEKAYAQLYTAIYHSRNILKEFNRYIQIQNVSDGYKLMLNNVKIDLVEWEDAIIATPSISIETLHLYEEIMKHYTDSYLKHYDFYWAEPERFRLEQIWIEVAMRMANCYEKHDYYEEAVKWYDKICQLNPHDEEASFALMKLYATLDYGLLVHHHYTQLENALKEIDIEMSSNIRNWYHQWRAK